MKRSLWFQAALVPAFLVPAMLPVLLSSGCGKEEKKKPGFEVEADEGGGGGGGSEPIPANAGSIEGVVKLTGAAPKPVKTDISGSEGCNHESVESEKAVVNANGTLRWCIASIESSQVAKYKFDVPKDTVEMDQKGCVYVPHVKTLMAGQPISFKNSDGALHNVHTYSTANKSMNTASPVGTTTKPVKWRKEEIFETKCDVHPWMSAYLGVFPHPYHAVSDDSGAFRLDRVPPGKYTLKVWHETFGTKEVEVEVPAGGKATVEVTFSA